MPQMRTEAEYCSAVLRSLPEMSICVPLVRLTFKPEIGNMEGLGMPDPSEIYKQRIISMRFSQDLRRT